MALRRSLLRSRVFQSLDTTDLASRGELSDDRLDNAPFGESPAWAPRIFQSLRARISLRAMSKVFPFSSLPTADLVLDAVYEGGTKGNTADDVLRKLIPGAGNQGGFPAVGSWEPPRLVILYSSMDDPD